MTGRPVRSASATILVGLVLGADSCAPRLRALGGAVVPATLPRAELPRGHRQITFEWEYADVDMRGRGEGVARVAWPDSARLDLFLAGGVGASAAVLVGDSLDMPGIELMRRMLPPPTLLWASLGRARLPATRDTVVSRDRAFLRADIGRPVDWRVTFRGDSLIRVDHVEGGRV